MSTPNASSWRCATPGTTSAVRRPAHEHDGEHGGHVHDVEDAPGATTLRVRLLVSAILAIPVVAMGMIPALQFSGWQWVSLVLTTPVVLWGRLALPPRDDRHRASRRGDHGHAHHARHGGRLPVERVGPGVRFGRTPRHPPRRGALRARPRRHRPGVLRGGLGGTVAADGRLVIRATGVGEQTRLAHIARLVEQAQTGKSRAQRLADRISAVIVPIVIALAAATLVAWLVAGQPATAFTVAVAVLIIACRCALGLATPIAILVGTGRSAQLGVLITGPEALEAAERVDTIVLDKTGTLTTGRMSLVSVLVDGAEENDADENDARRRIGALEAASEHPVAQAIAVAHPLGHRGRLAGGQGRRDRPAARRRSRGGHGGRRRERCGGPRDRRSGDREGRGADVAMHASDIALVRDDPRAILTALRLSRRTMRVVRGNLFWEFAYNVAAIPLAAAGLLKPMLAGAAMAFSSIFAVLNSLRLRRAR